MQQSLYVQSSSKTQGEHQLSLVLHAGLQGVRGEAATT